MPRKQRTFTTEDLNTWVELQHSHKQLKTKLFAKFKTCKSLPSVDDFMLESQSLKPSLFCT